MESKLYVGNLPFRVSETRLEEIFSQYGAVKSVKIISDRETGRSRGFGFVEMGNTDEAQECVDNLNGFEEEGRALKVSIAQNKPAGGPRPGGNRGNRF